MLLHLAEEYLEEARLAAVGQEDAVALVLIEEVVERGEVGLPGQAGHGRDGLGEGHDRRAVADVLTFVRELLVREVDGGLAFLTVVPDAWLGAPLAIRLEKRSGSHTLRIARKGYVELRRSVDTLTDDQLTLPLEAVPAPARPVPPVRPTIRSAPVDAGVTAPLDAAVAAPVDAPARRSDGGLGTNLTP